MSDTTGENSSENNENQEKKVNKKIDQNYLSLTSEARGSFIRTKLGEDLNFFDKKDYDEIHNDFYDYIKNKSQFDEVLPVVNNLGTKEKKVIFDKIKKDSTIEKITIDKNIDTAKKVINNEFRIKDQKTLDKKLKEIHTSGGGKGKIKDILKNKIDRVAFLETNLKDKYEKIEDTDNELEYIISKLKGINIDELTEEQLFTLKKIYNSRMELDTQELMTFLGFLGTKNIDIILNHLNPTLKLSDLIDLGVVSIQEAQKIVKKGLNNVDITDKELKQYYSSSRDFDEIFINISELNNKNKIKFFDSREAVENLKNELNNARREVEKEEDKLFDNDDLLPLDESNEEKTFLHNNFISFIKKHGSFLDAEIINTIDNFKQGGYIKLSSGGQEILYYIDEVDLGTTKSGKQIRIKNLSSKYGVKEPEFATSENMTYLDLFNIMKNISKSKDNSLVFLDKNAIDNSGLEKAPNESNISTQKDLISILKKDGFLSEGIGENTDFINLKFKDKDKGIEFYRTFTGTNDKTHTLTFEGSGQEISYSDFLAEFRKSKKYKLEKKIDNLNNLIDSSTYLSDNIEKSNHGNYLVRKGQKDNKKAVEVKTFIADNGDTVTIDKIDENGITFFIGKQTKNPTEKKVKKKIKGKEKDVVISKMYHIENKIRFDDFDNFALIVDNKKDLNIIDDEDKISDSDNDAEELKQSSTFMGKVFSLTSIAEVIQGGKMMTNAIKEYFERGNELRAAKFAKMFGTHLPPDVREKLNFNLTEKKKENIEKIYKELTEADGGPAMKRITERILGNSSALPEETMAAMQFMLKKRGGLYAKTLRGREKDFVWYQKLGGKKGDAYYNKIKAKIDKQSKEETAAGKTDPIFFTEEMLILSFLEDNKGMYYPRVDKDFDKWIGEGQENRAKKGENDATNAFTISERLEYFKDQLTVGEHSRALGAMGKIIGKNSSYDSIYYPGFLIAMSGVSERFNRAELVKLHGESFQTPSTALLFTMSKGDLKIYQNALIDYYNDTNQKNKASQLSTILNKSNYADRITDLDNFWSENSKEIMDFFNVKDGHIITNKHKNPNYQTIYETYKGSFNSTEFNIKENDFLGEGKFNNTALGLVGAKIDSIDLVQDGSLRDTYSRKLFDLYCNELLNIKKIPKDKISDEERKKLWINTFKPFGTHIYGKLDGIYQRQEGKSSFYTINTVRKLKKYNIEIPFESENPEIIKDPNYLEEAYNHFMNNNIIDDTDDLVEESNKKVINTLDINDFKDETVNNTDYKLMKNK